MLNEAELAAIRQRAADWHEHTGRHIEASPSAMDSWSADVHFDRARLLEHLDALTAGHRVGGLKERGRNLMQAAIGEQVWYIDHHGKRHVGRILEEHLRGDGVTYSHTVQLIPPMMIETGERLGRVFCRHSAPPDPRPHSWHRIEEAED